MEVIEVTEREVEIIEVVERGPAGPTGATGPQGPAGAGGVTSVTGTAPIVSSGGTTPAISVTVGSAANTVCAGNDSRIANIRSGSINTSDGTGSIELGQSGTRTTLNGAASGSDKTIALPNATGTLALTQQATDYEVTDDTKGVIMKSPNGTRWRVTFDNNGSLLRTTLATLILSALMLCGTRAQVRDLVYRTNGEVIVDTGTNTLTFTNTVRVSSGQILSPLGTTNFVGVAVGSTSSGLASDGFIQGNIGIVDDGELIALFGKNAGIYMYKPITFASGVEQTRTNLGLGSLATNNSVPSGAAATNSILTADGAGGSSFVVSRTVTRFTTNDQTKTNWGFNAVTQVTNNDTQMGSWSLDANSMYRVEYAVAWVATTNSGFNHGVGFTTNLAEFNHRSGIGQAANSTITAITTGTNVTVLSLPSGSAAGTGDRFAVAGFVYVLTSSNPNTMSYRWWPISNVAGATTLVRSSMLSVTKMSP